MDIAILLELLESHVPFDGQEATDLARVTELLQRNGVRALARNHFEPGHVTASAYVRSAGRMLLIEHVRLGMWLQPGGHVEPEDWSIEMAARREVEEETGLTELRSLGLLDVDVHEIPAARGEPTHLHFDLSWGFDGEGAPIVGDGVSGAKWVPFNDVKTLGTDASLLRGVSKLRA